MKKTLFLLASFFWFSLNAQEPKKEKDENAEKTIADLTKSSHKIEGLFTIYRDSISGKIKLMIKENQLDERFIYFSQIADGVTEAGSFRGLYRGSSVFTLKKHFDKIELVAPNTNFYFDPTNPLSKSQGANTTNALISSSKILVHDKAAAAYLIDANDLILSETLTRINPPRSPSSSPKDFKLGSFDKAKSKIKDIKNYTDNTNIKTEYVFKNPSFTNGGSSAVQDARNVSIKVFHSFMQMPSDGYQIRLDDPRVGYFTTQVNDMTSLETTNYRDLVHRWRLVKKDSSLAISEPEKPITWWIENTTPIEWREIIEEGVLAWNTAFEKAGFKNAIVVKQQPDDATWDAGDVNYNVLRWTSSPRPPFSGYGPSMVNPISGEILASDIMLEFAHFTGKAFYDRLFSDAQANMDLSKDDTEPLGKTAFDGGFCSFGTGMHENLLFGQTVLTAVGASDLELKQLNKEALKSLVMHEIGHTLGLNHNMKGSQLFSPEQLSDPEFIKGKALTASVMDYEAINITLDKKNQGQYENMAVGPYDVWAIQFGYAPMTGEERTHLLDQSTSPELIFGNDADDMRSPGKAIDPRVMTYDLSSDPIRYSIDRFKVVDRTMQNLLTRFLKEGSSYEDLRKAYYVLNAQAGKAGEVISRYIGGVYVDRAMYGQKGGTQPYTPVSLSDQKRAFKALNDYIFSPSAFQVSPKIYTYLARQRRGFDFFERPEDPKIHDLVLGYQTRVLAHLMHPNTLQRIMDSELYGNQYRLATFMTDLTTAMFAQDIQKDVNTFRQNLQAVYVKRLINMVTGKSAAKYKIPIQSLALYQLKKIAKMTKNKKGGVASIAHKTHLNTLIKNTLTQIK
ncbi:MAG: zinc-dependent metalloprotease [Flavobacteriaceae bacterium]